MYATFSRPRRPRYVNCKSCAPVWKKGEKISENFDVATFGFQFFFSNFPAIFPLRINATCQLKV